MRMWDLRANKCEGILQTPTKSAIAFDQQVGANSQLSASASTSSMRWAFCHVYKMVSRLNAAKLAWSHG